MNLLAIDTTRKTGSAALLLQGDLVEVVRMDSGLGFDEVLFGVIGNLLERYGVAMDGLDGFAAASGPGSFTGTRVGLSAIKALSEVHQKPLVGVSTLQTLAGMTEFTGVETRVALLDARRGEMFMGAYNKRLNHLVPECIGTWEFISGKIEQLSKPVRFVANEPHLFEESKPASAVDPSHLEMVPQELAGAVARLAWRAIRDGHAQKPEAIDANYIQRPSARPSR